MKLITFLFDLGGKDQRKGGVPQGSGYSDDGLSVQETAAVFANFEFLANQEMDMDEIDDLDAKQMHHTTGKQGMCIKYKLLLYVLANDQVVQYIMSDNFLFMSISLKRYK